MTPLEKKLRQNVTGEVRFDSGSRALYATDSSNYRQTPIGVVLPKTKTDVINAVAACREAGVPLLSRGGGTSLAGQCCNEAVILDMSKYYNKILELDPARRVARVQPGLVLDELRNRAEEHHLTFGPDPATHNRCTLGGMMGNNSCGVHALMAGKTVDNVEELEILTYDGLRLRVGPTTEEELDLLTAQEGREGEIYRGLRRLRDHHAVQIRARYPRIPRRVSGYNLDQLLPENGFHLARALIGSESTCVTILEASLRLVPSPPSRTLVVLGFDDIFQAGDAVPSLLVHEPIGLEAVDDVLARNIRIKKITPENLSILPEGRAWLLVEFGGDSREQSDGRARAMMDALGTTDKPPSMRLYDDKAEEQKAWDIREAGLGATAYVPGEPDTWEGWEDSAVPPDKVGAYLRKLHELYDRYGYHGALYGHFGQGCIHTRINFDLVTHEGIRKFRAFLSDAADLVVSFGGSLSGEHGDGQSKAELLPKMFGEELIHAFEEFKLIWDPQGKMNPGKIVRPFRADENLRLGVDYAPPPLKTHFQFPADQGSFARATLRCVGVGACRRHEGGVMCPSYMVTREERHSTRGRAHLLFEMLSGKTLKGGWRSKPVKEALDLCLACKGCRTECPVNVDMATYKAEFLSHYYRWRLRPLSAYTMGLIPIWARLAAPFARLVNFFTQTPVLRGLAKALAGIHAHRSIPRFALTTFRKRFERRTLVVGPRTAATEVLLWPDTFNNHFHPEVAEAAVEVLEDLGFRVRLPRAGLCCGRPFYDFGMLGLARRYLERILSALREDIRAGVPLIVLEPSCFAVFRDELLGLLPDNQDAKRLKSQTFLLSEFLEKFVPQYTPRRPLAAVTALVQAHCHHKALAGFGAEERLLKKLGLDSRVLESGCCGMAGAFGFEKSHYDVSMACGERALFPAVTKSPVSTLILADGFSCREQIAQGTGRRALHLAEVLQLALAKRADAGLSREVTRAIDQRDVGKGLGKIA